MKEINEQDMSEILKSEKLVIVDLFATWCGPCKALAPKLEELSKENSNKVDIVKMDVDKNQETPSANNVRGVPTLLFYKKGNLVAQIAGNQAKETIQELIDKHSDSKNDVDFGTDF